MKNAQHFIVWLALLVFSSVTFASQNSKAAKADVPPSAKLVYTVKAQYNGLDLNGNSFIRWKAGKQSYSLQNEAKISLLGKLLDADSNGKIDASGLIPEKYTEKRIRKDRTTTTFNYTENVVSFRENKTAPLKETVQDRASIVWQLASVARANPERFTLNSTWTFPVAGRSKIEPWTFRVVKTGSISTPMGQIKTVQLTRNGKKDQEMHVWLAPEKNWYPVQILFNERGGLQLLQTVKEITPLPD